MGRICGGQCGVVWIGVEGRGGGNLGAEDCCTCGEKVGNGLLGFHIRTLPPYP